MFHARNIRGHLFRRLYVIEIPHFGSRKTETYTHTYIPNNPYTILPKKKKKKKMHPLITLLRHLVHAMVATVHPSPPRFLVAHCADEFIRDLVQSSYAHPSDMPYNLTDMALRPFYANKHDIYPTMLQSTPPDFFRTLYTDLINAATPQPSNLGYRIALAAACTTFNITPGVAFSAPQLKPKYTDTTVGAPIMVMINARHLPHDEFAAFAAPFIQYINVPNGNLLYRAIFYYIYTITYNLPHLPIPAPDDIVGDITADIKKDAFMQTLFLLNKVLTIPRRPLPNSRFTIASVGASVWNIGDAIRTEPPGPRAAIIYAFYIDICMLLNIKYQAHPDDVLVLHGGGLQPVVTRATATFGIHCFYHMWWLFHECNMSPLLSTTGDLVWPRTFTEQIPYTTYPARPCTNKFTRPFGIERCLAVSSIAASLQTLPGVPTEAPQYPPDAESPT
jgi:hypothetical protein